jgi:hypothetical protein
MSYRSAADSENNKAIPGIRAQLLYTTVPVNTRKREYTGNDQRHRKPHPHFCDIEKYQRGDDQNHTDRDGQNP